MKGRKIVAPVLVLLAAGALLYFYRYLRPEIPASEIEASGHIEVTEVDMSFRLAGHVTRLLVEEGDRVKKDALLAELEQTVLRARLDQSAAQVRELEAREASLALATKIKEETVTAEVKRARVIRNVSESGR